MESQLRRLLTRMTGYDVLVRVRVSSGGYGCIPSLPRWTELFVGLRLDEHYGNFHQRTEAPDELSLGIVHADTAFSVALSHTAKLSAREHAHIQCAVLYTSVDGERRVRVVNLALNVADLAGTVFRFADMDAVVTHLAKMAVSTLPRKRMDSIREDLSNRCAEILLGYRKNCAVATQPSQLILPEAFKALPMYTLGILKSKPLKGKNVSSDVRNYHIHRILGMGCQSIMNYVYPRVLALHDLDDKIALPDANHEGRIWYPSHTRASYVWMEGHGIYLVGMSPFTSSSLGGFRHILMVI
jgi:protein transport protein SEC24